MLDTIQTERINFFTQCVVVETSLKYNEMQLNKSFHIFYTVATLVLMFLSCDISAEQNLKDEISLDQAIQQQLAKEQDNPLNTNLKRKRRYLEFPDGSSFQLGNF